MPPCTPRNEGLSQRKSWETEGVGYFPWFSFEMSCQRETFDSHFCRERFLYWYLIMLFYCPKSFPGQKHHQFNLSFSFITLSSHLPLYCNIFQHVTPHVSALSHENISKGCWSADVKARQPNLELWVYLGLLDLSPLSPWPSGHQACIVKDTYILAKCSGYLSTDLRVHCETEENHYSFTLLDLLNKLFFYATKFSHVELLRVYLMGWPWKPLSFQHWYHLQTPIV